ncbi:Zinc finger protein [Plecturocebus cupreus]
MRRPLTLCTLTGSCSPELLLWLLGLLGDCKAPLKFCRNTDIIRKSSGGVLWLMPIIQALWEADGVKSPKAATGKMESKGTIPCVTGIICNFCSFHDKEGSSNSVSTVEMWDYSLGIMELNNLTLLPRLEYSGMILAHCSLCLLGSSDSFASVSRVAGITSMYHHAQLTFVFLVEMGFTMLARLVSNSWLQVIQPLSLPKCWDYRHEPPCPARVHTFLNIEKHQSNIKVF